MHLVILMHSTGLNAGSEPLVSDDREIKGVGACYLFIRTLNTNKYLCIQYLVELP